MSNLIDLNARGEDFFSPELWYKHKLTIERIQDRFKAYQYELNQKAESKPKSKSNKGA